MEFMNKSTRNGILLEEPTLFERSRPGARGTTIPAADVPQTSAAAKYGNAFRKNTARLPEVSETEVVRHFSRLSTWNYAVDFGIFPLGSCTMKYNPRHNEAIARSSEISLAHPYDPEEWTQGHMAIIHDLTEDLKKVTGMVDVSLQPCAGAHGEYTGLALVAAYERSKGRNRRVILTPDTSHGTNPASAAMAGFTIKQIATGEDGVLHPDTVRAAMTDDVVCLMITNPNTIGFFEKHVEEFAKILHEKDGFLYIDGANLNAIMGIVRPGDFGCDVIQLNLHKTFSTPHGGGGPGSGPVGVSSRLVPFLPAPRVEKHGEKFVMEYNKPQSIGRVKAFFGNYSVMVRAWAYIKSLGSSGLRAVSENAIINANYLKAQLGDVLSIPVENANLHEIIFNDNCTKAAGLDTTKIAKRLIDYGMHPPTMHFPLCVKNAIMVEPTETEDRTELDRFVNAVKEIVASGDTGASPMRAFREKIDEAKAARELKLKFSFDR
jgi:glycine dehydrogenase subunit 2